MGWGKATLDQLCEFKNGLWKGKKEPFIHVGVIRNTNFSKNGTLDDSDIAYLDVEEKQYSSRKLEFGDLILEKSGGGPNQPVGRVIPFEKQDGEFSFSNFTSIIRIKDRSRLDYSYLHKYLHYLYETGATEPMQRQSTGIRNLQLKEYKLVEVPLPSIPEQKRIVAILDQAFADIDKARALTEQNLKNARELFESCLNERLLSVCSKEPTKTLSCITELIVDCEHKTAPVQSEGYPSIRTPNIGKGDLLLDGVKRVSQETYEAWTRRAIPKAGDLILAREAPAGNIGVIPAGLQVCLGQRTVLIRPDEAVVNSKYLAFFLLHPIVQKRLLAHSTGATVQHINMKDIRSLAIAELPPIDKQEADVDVLIQAKKHIANLERIYLDKLYALGELKRAILQKAFSGELTKASEEVAA